MTAQRLCPRCGEPLDPPGLLRSSWRCERHGEVAPLEPASPPNSRLLHGWAAESDVPVWVPWPLPTGWLISGVVRAGDPRFRTQAVAVALSGPAPLGGAGDLVLVAEKPGVGLGAWLAGLAGSDPGPGVWAGQAAAKVSADGHPTALWNAEGEADRATYVGEAEGLWLWAVLWPADAGHLLADDITLVDVRSHGPEFDLPCGVLSTRLPHA